MDRLLYSIAGMFRTSKDNKKQNPNGCFDCFALFVLLFSCEIIKMKIKYYSKIMDFAIIENSFRELSRINDNKKAIEICKRLELQVSKKRIKEFNDMLFKVSIGWDELIQWSFIYSNYKIYKIWNKHEMKIKSKMKNN